MPATDTSFIIEGGHSVVFWNARYVGATEEGDNFEAEYMLFEAAHENETKTRCA